MRWFRDDCITRECGDAIAKRQLEAWFCRAPHTKYIPSSINIFMIYYVILAEKNISEPYNKNQTSRISISRKGFIFLQIEENKKRFLVLSMKHIKKSSRTEEEMN